MNRKKLDQILMALSFPLMAIVGIILFVPSMLSHAFLMLALATMAVITYIWLYWTILGEKSSDGDDVT